MCFNELIKYLANAGYLLVFTGIIVAFEPSIVFIEDEKTALGMLSSPTRISWLVARRCLPTLLFVTIFLLLLYVWISGDALVWTSLVLLTLSIVQLMVGVLLVSLELYTPLLRRRAIRTKYLPPNLQN